MAPRLILHNEFQHLSHLQPRASPQLLQSQLQPIVDSLCLSCIVEDNNPRVLYSEEWILNVTTFGTEHLTSLSGSTIQLQFNGSSITVFGAVLPNYDATDLNSTKFPAIARYTIDQFEPVETQVPITNTIAPILPFFSANALSTQEHNITIEVLEADLEAPYIFQNFYITPHNSVTRTGSPRTSDPGTVLGSPKSERPFTDTRSNPVPTPSSLGPDIAPPTIGQIGLKAADILVAVFGSVVISLFVGTAILCYVRKKRIAEQLSSRLKSKFWKYAPRNMRVPELPSGPDTVQVPNASTSAPVALKVKFQLDP